MKKIKLLTILLSIFIISCTKNANTESNVEESFFVTENDARDLALLVASDVSVKSGGYNKVIEEVSVEKDDNNNALYYLINFTDNGYYIISADKRAYPILGFSNEGRMDTEFITRNPELRLWMKTYADYIKKVRVKNIIDKKILQMWNSHSLKNAFNPPTKVEGDGDIEFECKDEYIENVNPRITTDWGQGYGYNYYCGNGGCYSNAYLSGKYPTGCTTTAIAQIAKYHEYPSSYNYSLMPNRINTNNQGLDDYIEIARLMRDIGIAGGAIYNCNGTVMSVSNSMSVITGLLNYSSATKKTFSYGNMTSSLTHGPALIGGVNTSTNSAHMWVCDGSARWEKCIHYVANECPKVGYTISYYLHMVFGYGEDVAIMGSNYTNSGWFIMSHIADGSNIEGNNSGMYIIDVVK